VRDARGVRGAERVRELLEDRQRFGRRERTSREPRREALAFEQLHHQVRKARRGVDAGGLHLDDVLARNARPDASLLLEAPQRLRIVDELLVQQLERAELARRKLVHDEHRPHAARRERSLDAVVPREDGPRYEW